MALKGIEHVDGRFVRKSARLWWAYRIAVEFHISPLEVKRWDSDDVMEALAAIGWIQKNSKSK